MPLPSILGGFETLHKHFFEIIGAKEQKEKTGKYRKRNFGGDILSISTDISAEISEILFPRYKICHLLKI